MPAKSDAQRRLMAMVLSAKRGKLKNPSPKVKKVSAGISESNAKDFATKRQGITNSLMTGKSGY